PSHVASGCPGPHRGARDARGDPRRTSPRERRPDEPLRRVADVDGDVRLREPEGVPEGGDHGRSCAADGGQVPPARAAGGHGPLRIGGVADAGAPSQVVLVVDFGAQYAQLIARRVREEGVYSEIVPHGISTEELRARAPRGVILSGG